MKHPAPHPSAGGHRRRLFGRIIPRAAVLGASLAAAAAVAAPPNILFIHMEDMGVQIPAYGDDTVATPNLDRLAEQGLVFERAHVTAATCAASRGSLFTGLYPHQNGIMGFVKQHGFYYRDGVPNFVADLKDAGYATGITYKDGVESAHYERNHPVPFDFHPKYTDNFLTGVTGKNAPNAKTEPPLASFSVDNFRYFLGQLEDGKPFYFQAQTPDTHHLWDRDWFIRDGDPGWPYPPVDLEKVTSVPGWGDTLVPGSALKKGVGDYYRAIQRTDWYVGRILDVLEEYGHADNTLVVFSADHGPSHLLRGKTTAGELGLRVPFIVRWPGKIADPGTRSDTLVSFVDLYPTFVDAAGLEIPAHLPGYSLVPVMAGEASPRKHLYSAYVAHTTGMHLYWPSRTVTDGRYKLIHNLLADGRTRRYTKPPTLIPELRKALENEPEGSAASGLQQRSLRPPEFEFYDLADDPDECVNLYGSEQVEAEQARLEARLAAWQEQVDDPFRDPAFLDRFTAAYKENHDLWESLGGYQMKDPRALDFSPFIPAWNPAPYLGKKDL